MRAPRLAVPWDLPSARTLPSQTFAWTVLAGLQMYLNVTLSESFLYPPNLKNSAAYQTPSLHPFILYMDRPLYLLIFSWLIYLIFLIEVYSFIFTNAQSYVSGIQRTASYVYTHAPFLNLFSYNIYNVLESIVYSALSRVPQ